MGMDLLNAIFVSGGFGCWGWWDGKFILWGGFAVISRTWHGVPKNKRTGFKAYLNQTGVKEAVEIDGRRGAYIQIVDQNEYSHFFLCTIWNTWEDITLYAGSKPYIAITYADDEQFGLISDPIVIHQEVSSCDSPFITNDTF